MGVSHACMHIHACLYDIIGISSWGQPFAMEIIMFNTYMLVCVHVCGTPPTYPHPHPPTSNQNSIKLELIEIIQFCLKIFGL